MIVPKRVPIVGSKKQMTTEGLCIRSVVITDRLSYG